MNNNEIKQANQKALPKFILMMIISMFVGGFLGYFIMRQGINELSGSIKNLGSVFSMYVASWIMVIIAILIPVLCVPIYNKAKKMLEIWDGEDELIYDEIDNKLSMILWITTTAYIFSFFLIAASYSIGLAIFDNNKMFFNFIMSIVSFSIIMIEGIIIQQKCIDNIKKMNPEKRGSVYDMKFQKKWIDSCDEAEKIIIGKCAYKSCLVTNQICTILALLLAIGALVFDIGFLPSFVVCIIWLVNQSIYYKEALHYSKVGNKIG